MDFFDSLISDALSGLEKYPQKRFSYSEENLWTDVGYNQVILQRETAADLNGTGFNLITSSEIKDEIIVAGDDLSEIRGAHQFARISIIQIEDESDEQKAYNLIRKIEYVKYHYFPEGYMLRTSSQGHKESVRVSEKAVKNGISFHKTGSLLVKKYKEIPAVKGVKIIYVTTPDADFLKIEKLAQKSNSITETLNHVMNSVRFDCDTCNLKAVCDEVEGMKELHFRMNDGK